MKLEVASGAPPKDPVQDQPGTPKPDSYIEVTSSGAGPTRDEAVPSCASHFIDARSRYTDSYTVLDAKPRREAGATQGRQSTSRAVEEFEEHSTRQRSTSIGRRSSDQ